MNFSCVVYNKMGSVLPSVSSQAGPVGTLVPINLPNKVGIKLGILYSIGSWLLQIWKAQQCPQD